jgi:hypothetical protein
MKRKMQAHKKLGMGFLIAILVFLFISNTQAQISGKTYLEYRADLASKDKAGDRTLMNAFDLTRFYVTLTPSLSEKVALKFTSDFYRADDGFMRLALKHGFVEFKNLLYPDSSVLFGQHDIPWVPYEEGLWGYRFQGTVFPDREGYLTSTDVGVGLKAKIPQGYGDYHISLVNGEGWKAKEVNRYKDIQARLTIKPLAKNSQLKNLFVTGFGLFGVYDKNGNDELDKRIRAIGQVGFKNEKVTLVGEYLIAQDPSDKMVKKHPSLKEKKPGEVSNAAGFSAFTELNASLVGLPNSWAVIGRVDQLDPDVDLDDNSDSRLIAGISYRANKNLQLLLDGERVVCEKKAGRKDETTVMLQMEAKY